MTKENGAQGGDVTDVNTEVETAEGQNGGAENANVDAEQLKQELATRDKKIAELLKAQKELEEIKAKSEADKIAQKTTEEKLEHYKKQVDDMHRENVLSRKLSEHGVSVEDANKILKGATAEEQAEALASLISNVKESASASTLESFKKDMLDKTQKSTPSTENKKTEDAFTAGMRRGAGV